MYYLVQWYNIHNNSIHGYSLDDEEERSVIEGTKEDCVEYAENHGLKYIEI